MTMLNPRPCYYEVYYKGNLLYCDNKNTKDCVKGAQW